MGEGMKKCSNCGELKERDKFAPRSDSPDGLRGQCHDCRSARQQRYNAANRQRKTNYNRRYYRDNGAVLRAYQNKYYRDNREHILEKGKEYYQRNQQRIREYGTTYRRNDRTTHLKRCQKWMTDNREYVRATYLTRSDSPSLTPDEFEALVIHIKSHWNDPCTYCGSRENMTFDHDYPRSRGGRSTPDNIVPSCGSCNSSKGQLTSVEYRQRIAAGRVPHIQPLDNAA